MAATSCVQSTPVLDSTSGWKAQHGVSQVCTSKIAGADLLRLLPPRRPSVADVGLQDVMVAALALLYPSSRIICRTGLHVGLMRFLTLYRENCIMLQRRF